MPAEIINSRATVHVQARAEFAGPAHRGFVFADEDDVTIRVPTKGFGDIGTAARDFDLSIQEARDLARAITEACDLFEQECGLYTIVYSSHSSVAGRPDA